MLLGRVKTVDQLISTQSVMRQLDISFFEWVADYYGTSMAKYWEPLIQRHFLKALKKPKDEANNANEPTHSRPLPTK